MQSIDLTEYERTATTCNALKGIEFDLLKETLASWKESPGRPYILLDLRDGRSLAAFAVISKAQGRDTTFEVRYIVVDRDYRASTGGASILRMIEEEVLRLQPSGLIQIEISRRKLACAGSLSLEDAGYRLIGHIPDFYGEGNDYFMYTKAVYRNPPKKDKPAAHPASQAASETPS